MLVSLKSYTKEPIQVIAEVACNCYDSQDIKEEVVFSCYKSGHHSVLEFADFHFHIEGVSRALSHQLVRHRLASFVQRSQRYVTEDGFTYVTPITTMGKEFNINFPWQPIENMTYDEMMVMVRKFYTAMVDQGVPPEDARMILPNACETVLDMKCNLREWMHFCNERLCNKAQWEIRQLAHLIKDEILRVEPKLRPLLVPKCMKHFPYNFCTETRQCKEFAGKVPKLSLVYKAYNDSYGKGVGIIELGDI